MTKFVADSSCDMLEYEGVNFEIASLDIFTDEVRYTDDADINITEMLDMLASYKGRSYTACPGVEAWLKAFEGGDRIYVVTLTSGLSGTYNSAVVAKDIYLQDNPDAQIEVFDTLSTGPELRLVVEKLIELDSQGLSFEEVCKKAREYMKKTRLFFSFISLHNFAQNGRVSKVVAAAVSVIGISIIGTASEEGTIDPISKCRGEKKVLAKLMDEFDKAGYKGGKLRICHVENEELAEKIIALVKEKYPDADAFSYKARGLCSYYAERGGVIIGCETE